MSNVNTLPANARAGALDFRRKAGAARVIFVDSASGAATGGGRTPTAPLNSIAAAILLCVANRGDVIVCLPSHAETITSAGAIAISIAGVELRGLGFGSNRPTLTFGTSAAATFLVSALNVSVYNFRFISNIDDLACFLDLTAGSTLFEDCELITSSTKEALCFAKMTTTKDEFTFRRCRFVQPTDPTGTDGEAGTGCFYLVDTEGLYLDKCEFYGNFETAIVHNKTTAAKRVYLTDCFGYQLLLGAEVFVQVTAMEGLTKNTTFILPACDDVSEAKSWGALSDKYFIDGNSYIGNDGVGGQLAVAGASVAT